MPRREGYQDAVNFTISFCLTFTVCIGAVRIWIRRGIYGWDDVVTAMATLVTLGHTGSSYAAVAKGLGKPWSRLVAQDSIVTLNDASIAGLVLFLVALYLSKCAMIWFLIRLTKKKSQILMYYICNGVFGVLCLVSIFTATVNCPFSSKFYWAFHANRNSCPSQSTRWQVVTALDIVTEAFLLVLPAHLVWYLQMPLTRKAVVLIAFFIRLPIIGFSIGRNYYTLNLRLPGSDAGLDSAMVVVWMEIELAYTLAASTLSALKSFTESFNSGFGQTFARGQGETRQQLFDTGESSGTSPSKEKSSPSSLDEGLDGYGTAINNRSASKSLSVNTIEKPTSKYFTRPAIRSPPNAGMDKSMSMSS